MSEPPGIGHNRPPSYRRLPMLPHTHEAVRNNMGQLLRLRALAIDDCQGQVNLFIRNSPMRFAPSRLTNWPTGRAMLADLVAIHWPMAIAKRLPQIRRYERKLARTCIGWPGLTEAQLTEPPDYNGDSTNIFDNWSVERLLRRRDWSTSTKGTEP
jgi:hypothetical protein